MADRAAEVQRQEEPGEPLHMETVSNGSPPPASPTAVPSLTVSGTVPQRSTLNIGWPRREAQRFFGLLFGSIVALLFFWQVQGVLLPFLIAFFLAALLDPAILALQKHGYSRVRAIVVIYMATLSIIAAIAVFVVPLVTDQVQDLSLNFNANYKMAEKNVNEFLHNHARQLQMLGIKEHRLNDIMQEKSGPFQASIAAALGGVTGFLSAAASRIFWLIIIPVAMFFFMRDYPVLRARIISLFPEPYQEQIDIMSREIVDVFGAYLRGLAKICALYALAATLIFTLMGLRYALFLGVMAGAFYAVPYVGQLCTGTACGIVAYSMPAHKALMFQMIPAHSMSYTITVILCAIVAQNLFDQLVYPRVVGASVGLYPVVSIFALMAGATLFGIFGMLLAVPVAASIQIILMYFFPKLKQPPPAHLLRPSIPAASPEP